MGLLDDDEKLRQNNDHISDLDKSAEIFDHLDQSRLD